MSQAPEVTIGLPVYNGADFFAAAVKSVIEQTFQNWELVISDNGSTDHTPEIARAAAARDPRVIFAGHRTNRGASWNFNFTIQQARGEYMQWLSHDDVLAPTFVERCVEALRADSEVVLAHTRVRIIDGQGAVLGDMTEALNRSDASTPVERFDQLLRADRWCYEVFGLMRTEVLRRTPGLAPHIASDRSLLAEMALRGRFRQVPEYLFFSRDHGGRSIRALPAHHLRAAWFDPRRAGKRVLPHWRICAEYLRCLGRTQLSLGDRIRCRLAVARWTTRDLNWARMAADLVLAVWPGAWRVMDRVSGSSRRWLAVRTSGDDEDRAASEIGDSR